MKFYTMLAILAATATLTFTGCRVEKTQEGELPDVEVRGDTKLPSYDVDAADIDVGTTETNVTVPTVDVNMPPPSDATPAPADATPVPNP